MRRTAAVAAGAAFVFSAGAAAPAVAVPSGSPVEIVAHTDFTSDVSEGVFVATIGRDRFEIDVAPWGEGDLKINGQQVAHLDGA